MPRQQSVRFPDDIAHAINREAERANRSFSYLVIEACRTRYLAPVPPTGRDAENERAFCARDAGTQAPLDRAQAFRQATGRKATP
jgi:predicted transcriptional regulator